MIANQWKVFKELLGIPQLTTIQMESGKGDMNEEQGNMDGVPDMNWRGYDRYRWGAAI